MGLWVQEALPRAFSRAWPLFTLTPELRVQGSWGLGVLGVGDGGMTWECGWWESSQTREEGSQLSATNPVFLPALQI